VPATLNSVQMSISHEICHLHSDLTAAHLRCAFASKDKPREFIVVR
jgi:hypothetical protein